MFNPSASSPTPDTAEQYLKLLRGEITSSEYVQAVRAKVRATRAAASRTLKADGKTQKRTTGS
jgi:hypothetical protein